MYDLKLVPSTATERGLPVKADSIAVQEVMLAYPWILKGPAEVLQVPSLATKGYAPSVVIPKICQ